MVQSGVCSDKREVAARQSERSGIDSDRHSGGGNTSVGSKEPWVHVNVDICDTEKQVITEFLRTQRETSREESSSNRKKDRKHSAGLPPGLQKKVARGGSLPPGWQAKCNKGEIMPEDVYAHCEPLPKEVTVKLPPAPAGTILITIDGKIARLVKATREILDVFEVKF